jgi:hypothetical protein
MSFYGMKSQNAAKGMNKVLKMPIRFKVVKKKKKKYKTKTKN